MLLALDTSTLSLSLALVEREAGGRFRVREALIEGPPKKQSERLPAVIEELLGRHGLRLEALEALVVGLGPGSFTGLRVGMATLKALSYAAKVPLCGASSLAAVALAGPTEVPLVPISVVRRGELYVGRYRREGGGRLVTVAPETALTPEALAQELTSSPDARVLGPAVEEYRETLEQHGVASDRFLTVAPVPLAENLVPLATLPSAYDVQQTFSLEPHYLRASAPEQNPKFPPLAGPPPQARIRED